MSTAIETAKSILKDTIHRGSVVIPKEDAVLMARGYLEFVRIQEAMQKAVNENRVDYAGVSVADNVLATITEK